MAKSFSASVDDWVKETQERMDAVFKDAVQTTVEEILDRTPVDTGFLKSSFHTSLTGFLPLVHRGVVRPNDVQIQMTIAQAEAGDTIYGNFTANYAVHVEYGARGRPGRRMVGLAAQNWQRNVDNSVRKAKAAVAGR
jgi:hypothetical protein